MDPKIYRFFSKNGFQEADIKYIVRENKKTNIYLLNGRVIETYTPLKTILPSVSQETFQNINKGIAVNTDCVAKVEDGIYLMEDGREFKGRARMPSVYRKEQEKRFQEIDGQWTREQVLHSLILFQEMPVGFCLLEYGALSGGGSDEPVVRYCNQKMESLLGLKEEDWKDMPVSVLEKHHNAQWMGVCRHIAQYGGTRVFSSDIDGISREIICYQPYPEYCACMMLDKADRRS